MGNSKDSNDKYDSVGEASLQTIAELQERLRLQDLIADLSTMFINLPPEQVDGQIELGLKRIVEFLKIDRSGFSEFSKDLKELNITHSYALPGIDPPPQSMIIDLLPWYGKNLQQGIIVAAEDTSTLSDEAAVERKFCHETGLKSHLGIPVSIGGSLICALGFDSLQKKRTWPEDLIEQLKRVTEIFALAIFHKRTHQEIQYHNEQLKNQFEFEKLISYLSARFVNLLPDEVDLQIEKGLKRVTEFLGVDRSTLLKFSNDKKQAVATHVYAVNDAQPMERILSQEQFPWITDQLLHDKTFYFSSANDLPVEAMVDRENLHKLGIKSIVSTPVFVEGELGYILTVGAVKNEYDWPKEIIPRLRSIGAVFVNGLIRKENAEALNKSEEELRSAYGKIERLSEKLKRENIYLQEEIKSGHDYGDMVGKSGGLKYIFFKIKQVAPTDATVLIEGETGSGKELVARALYELSSRKDHPLIKVDCSSLPANTIESELFGHEKGAFTGAHAQRIGRFELADGGTIFLDEIGELPLELQVKLLRVLQQGEFERLGSSRTLKVDVRIIAATNRDLQEEVKKGNFRQDLYYRLNVFPLSIPPLRERKEDIAALTEVFLSRFAKKFGKNITAIPPKVQNALQNYSWPGNVRELENVIERAVITTEGPSLQLMDILDDSQTIKAESAPKENLQERERDYILKVLEETYWRIEGKNGAALILGLHPDTLRSRMKKLGIRRQTLQH